jgi:serine protease Do
MKKLALFTLFALMLMGCSKTINVAKSIDENSFILIVDETMIHDCVGPGCKEGKISTVGSAFVIANAGEDSIAATAGHVCEGALGNHFFALFKRKVTASTFDGNEHPVNVLKIYPEYDVCIIQIKGVSLPPMRVSNDLSDPDHGEKVYTIAAPLGIHGKGLALVMDGYYSGVDAELMGFYVYTIPTQSGSSGSPVLNSKGEVIGIISMKREGFENLCMSPPAPVVKYILLNVIDGVIPKI